jgi:hypothetical protein
MAIWRSVASLISKATLAHSRTHTHIHTDKYAMLIAFPRREWFRERALMIRYTYIACLAVL